MLGLFYAVDGTMLALAIAAAVYAIRQTRERVVQRWIVLAPGVLASLASIALLSYPDVRDLAAGGLADRLCRHPDRRGARRLHGHGLRPHLKPSAPEVVV